MRCRNRVLVALGCVFLLLGILACGGYYCARRCSYPLSAFQDCAKFFRFKENSLDVVNVGSNSGKFSFDWEGVGVAGGNLAMSPQCGTYDFAVLRRCKKYLRSGAVVLIVVCPFSCICGKDYPLPDKCAYAKYYALLDRDEMTTFSPKEWMRMWLTLNVRHPNWLAYAQGDMNLTNDVPSTVKYREDMASRYKDGWMRQFSLKSFEDPIPAERMSAFEWNVRIYRAMIDWCVANGFTPVMVFPPLSKEFSGLFGTKFCENYLSGFYKAIDRSDTPYYDYLQTKWQGEDFTDGFRLNRSARLRFTRNVVARLKKDGILKGGGCK